MRLMREDTRNFTASIASNSTKDALIKIKKLPDRFESLLFCKWEFFVFGIKVIIDGAQSVPHTMVDVKKMDMDFWKKTKRVYNRRQRKWYK